MFCIGKEQLTCNSEKLGCEGCFYNDKNRATEKQIRYVNRIVDYLGKEKVEEYIHKFNKTANIDNLTKVQAQKIITGLDAKLPKKPIKGVYGTYM